MSSHLIDLPAGAGWTLWRWAMVRAAGFPARGVLDLADLDAAREADALAALDRELAELRATAIAEILRQPDRVDRKALRRLRRGNDLAPADVEALAGASPAIGALPALVGRRADQQARFDAAFDAAMLANARAIHAWAGEPRFREALLWQNRAAVHSGLDVLLRRPLDAADSRTREKCRLVAQYIQRYCLKNDTIGFFGPIGWAEVTATGDVVARPGRALLARREVYWEHWAIDLVADALAAAGDTRRELAPRLAASIAVTGTTVRHGLDRSSELPPVVARLLAACDGATPAREIARALAAGGELDEDDVYDLLHQLVERGYVIWALEPSAIVHPERELARAVERIGSPELRAPAAAALARLEAARAAVAGAAGDSERLAQALAELDAALHEVTGQATQRRAGEVYAGRTPIYEDCVRDLSLVIGRAILDRLSPVFALVARSARWFTFELATRYRALLDDCFAQLAAAAPDAPDAPDARDAPVGYLRFWRAAQDVVTAQGGVLAGVAGELAARWAAILEVDPGQRRVELAAAAIAGRVSELFAAPGPGWPSARHVSPDVMVAARSVDDIARGDFVVVLGEVHPCNGLIPRFLLPHGPGDALMRALELDLAEPGVRPVEPKHLATRADSITWSPRDFDLELAGTKSWRPRDHVLAVADLVVERHAGALVVRDVRRGHRFDVIAFLEGYLLAMAVNQFKPFPHAPHVPRITIDGVVLCREQWRLSPAEFPAFVDEARGALQFAGARAWANALGLPRWVFVKIPEEPKPIFVDFASPIYVELLAHLVRRASGLTISEMLPTLEDTWIPDAAGNTYTGELRMVGLDPVTWARPG